MKRFATHLFALLALLLAANMASAFEYNGMYFDVNGTGTVMVTGLVDEGSGSGSLVIPSVAHNIYTTISWVDGKMVKTEHDDVYTVNAIGGYAFAVCESFTSLSIPNTVTTIKNNAFYACTRLAGSLIIPESVTTIGDGAFKECFSFTSLSIPSSVTSIGNEAFSSCVSFSGSLAIPNSVTAIGNSAFCGCTGFSGSLTIGNSVTAIGDNAFLGCDGFTSLVIPNSVSSIGKYAFGCWGLNLISSKVMEPKNVSLGENIFYYYYLKDWCVLHVPVGTVSKYRACEQWKDFFQIVEENDAVTGDLSGDGNVDVDDLNIIINIMLDKAKTSVAADVNDDGIVDVDDLNTIINIMLEEN